MTPAVLELLDMLDRLADHDRREALSEILRRMHEIEWPTIDDETLAQIADESFRDYDDRERARGLQ